MTIISGNPRVEGYDKSHLGVIDKFHKYHEEECIICGEEMWAPSLYTHVDYCDVCEKKYAKHMEAKQQKDAQNARQARLKELGVLK